MCANNRRFLAKRGKDDPLEARLAAVPATGSLLDWLFAPLGYCLEVTRHPLDPCFPEWGDSRYYTVRLAGKKRLSELLTHLYVLLPVLDDEKHYYVGVEKLLQRGEGWLADHPERELSPAMT